MIEWGFEEKIKNINNNTVNLLFIINFPNTKGLWTGI